ncbi:MAG: glycosyl hydrolase, partial [Kiritimatiellae bacterium]|nr:glycosyl hydrolase [Kiritimatiellia bacterium]
MRCLLTLFAVAALGLLSASAALTPETASFYDRLKAVADEGRFYYSFYAPWCNRHDLEDLGICREAGRVPQLYFLEFYYVAGTWRKPAEYATNRQRLTETVKNAYTQYGSVPVFSWHPENPYAEREKISPTNSAYAFPYRYRYATEGYPQEHRYVIREILNGVDFPSRWYEVRLQEIASFLQGLVDAQGRPIPTVVRLFHECEDDWHWWGRESVTVTDYIAFWRMTVSRLRELTGGGKNLLFLYSPDRYWNKVG